MNYELRNQITPQYSPIEQVLFNRGILQKDMEHFLNVDENDTYPATQLKNIEQGAKMLIQHIANNDKIFVQVDSDCDGFTSSALLINYLNRFAPYFTQTHITYRMHIDKSHGLIFDTIPEGTKLVIVPDAGSNDYDVHVQCAAAGIDVLVLDHHTADYESPSACVINNQLCDYPTKSLSGVGIVYKFCSYIDSLAGTDYADDYLDLVSLGLIADVMDTRDFETQHYIQQGLRQVRNPLLKALIDRDGMHFKSSDVPLMNSVAWYVAPLINAATRVGSETDKRIIFEAMLEFKAYTEIPSTKRGCKGMMETVVEQACRTATNVKNHQDDYVADLLILAEKEIEEKNLLDNQVLMIYLEGSSKNLNGLVANKLAAKYQRPVLMLQRMEHEADITYEGSARGYDKSDLKDFQTFLQNSGLVNYAQGHKNAFGVGFPEQNWDLLQQYCNERLNMGEIKYEVDFIWDAKRVEPSNVLSIACFKHLWGQKVEEPLIVLENLRLTDQNVSFIGKNGKTLRIDTDGYSIIKFFVTDEEKENLTTNGETWTANVVVTCDANEWGGKITPQFKLVDIEITEKAKWVF